MILTAENAEMRREILPLATMADVEEVFRFAYDLNCKGVTVYRDGSRKNQVITAGTCWQRVGKNGSSKFRNPGHHSSAVASVGHPRPHL